MFGPGRWSNFSVKPRPRCEYRGYQWPDNFKMHTYAKSDQNIPCGSKIMSIFTNLPRPAGLKLSKAPTIKTMLRMTVVRRGLGNVDMHTYATFDQNIPCGSRVMSILTNC